MYIVGITTHTLKGGHTYGKEFQKNVTNDI